MRICFISNFYPPAGVSGADRYIWDVTHKLAKKGIKIEVIAPQPKNRKLKKIEKKKNLTIHRLNFMSRWNAEDPKTKARKLINYLQKIIKKRKIDLLSSQALHLWEFYTPAYALASNLISINNKIPNILTIHAPFINEVDKIAPKTLFWDKIINVSNSLSEEVHSLGVDIEKISTCYPGVDLEKFKPGLGRKWLMSRIDAKEKEKIILFAGRISDAKGVPTLLKSFSTIAKTKKDVKLLLAAAGNPDEEIIKNTYEKAELLGIRDKIHIHSFELDEMPLVYNGCDLFVMPSQYEGFGLVYTEAMACRIPVIGTSVGGIPEIITNGVDGYLVPPDDPTELSKRIEWLLKSKKKRLEMGEKGLEKIRKNFDLNKTTEKLLGVYRSVIEKRK